LKICCDIDGTLADVKRLVKKYLSKKGDWETYFLYTSEMPVIPITAEIVRALYLRGHDLYIVTGRPESNRGPTEVWLGTHVLFGSIWFPYVDRLLMRPNYDRRSTHEVKLEWFKEIKPGLIIDDDPEVVEAASKEGFKVLQVHGFRYSDKDMVPPTP